MMFITNLMLLRAHGFVKPAFRVGLSLIYFHTNVLFLYAAQSDFWAERRKAVEAFKNQNNTAFNPAVPNPNSAIPKLLAQLPALQTSLSVIATTGLNGGKQTQVTPSHEIATSPLATRNDNHKTNAITLKHYNSITPSFSSITPYAEIKEIYTPSLAPGPVGNGFKPFPTVVIIQDVHQHYEAQKNISFVLQRIVEAQRNDTEQQESVIASIAKQSLATSNREIATSPLATRNDDPRVVVGLEGAVGPFDFSPYRAYSDKKLTADIADSFMKEGMIGGPEFYGITAPDNQLMPMVGVEDGKLYLDNIQAFKDSLPVEKQVKIEVEIKKQEVKVKKEKIFNKSLLELDRKREAYHEDKLGLGDYLTALVNEVNGSRRLQPAQIKVRRINPAATTKIYLSVYLLVEAYQIEKSLDFTKVDKERAQIIEVLSEKLSKARLNELVQVSLAYRTGNITYAQFYAIFKAMAQDAGINFDVFPEMSQYIKYVLLTDKIDKNRLFDEIIQLEKSLENHLAKTPEEKQLLTQSKYLELVKKLVEFSLTPEEWKQYLQYRSRESEDRSQDNDKSPFHPPFLKGERGGLSLSLKPFEKFYETALKRNEALVSNLLRQVKNETGKGKEQGSRRLQPAHSMERRLKPATTNLPALNSNSSFSTFTSTCRFSVLVAGGFHTQGITQLLKQKSLPYIVLTPNITKVEEGQKSLELLARGKTPLEKLFSGEKIFLVAPLATGSELNGYELKPVVTETVFLEDYLGAQTDQNDVDEVVRQINSGSPNLDITKAEYKNYQIFSTVRLLFRLKTKKSKEVFKFVVVRVSDSMINAVESLRNYKQIINKTKEVSSFKIRDYWISIRQEKGSLFDWFDLDALNSKDTMLSDAGVIPIFQRGWQKFMQFKLINWLFPNLKRRVNGGRVSRGRGSDQLLEGQSQLPQVKPFSVLQHLAAIGISVGLGIILNIFNVMLVNNGVGFEIGWMSVIWATPIAYSAALGLLVLPLIPKELRNATISPNERNPELFEPSLWARFEQFEAWVKAKAKIADEDIEIMLEKPSRWWRFAETKEIKFNDGTVKYIISISPWLLAKTSDKYHIFNFLRKLLFPIVLTHEASRLERPAGFLSALALFLEKPLSVPLAYSKSLFEPPTVHITNFDKSSRFQGDENLEIQQVADRDAILQLLPQITPDKLSGTSTFMLPNGIRIKWIGGIKGLHPNLKSASRTVAMFAWLLTTQFNFIEDSISKIYGSKINLWAKDISTIQLGYYASGNNKLAYKVNILTNDNKNFTFVMALKEVIMTHSWEEGELETLRQLRGSGLVPNYGDDMAVYLMTNDGELTEYIIGDAEMGRLRREGRAPKSAKEIHFYIEEFIEGPTLTELSRTNKLSEKHIQSIAETWLRIWRRLHGAAPVDINPSNFVFRDNTLNAIMVDVGEVEVLTPFRLIAIWLFEYGGREGFRGYSNEYFQDQLVRILFDAVISVLGKRRGVKFLKKALKGAKRNQDKLSQDDKAAFNKLAEYVEQPMPNSIVYRLARLFLPNGKLAKGIGMAGLLILEIRLLLWFGGWSAYPLQIGGAMTGWLGALVPGLVVSQTLLGPIGMFVSLLAFTFAHVLLEKLEQLLKTHRARGDLPGEKIAFVKQFINFLPYIAIAISNLSPSLFILFSSLAVLNHIRYDAKELGLNFKLSNVKRDALFKLGLVFVSALTFYLGSILIPYSTPNANAHHFKIERTDDGKLETVIVMGRYGKPDPLEKEQKGEDTIWRALAQLYDTKKELGHPEVKNVERGAWINGKIAEIAERHSLDSIKPGDTLRVEVSPDEARVIAEQYNNVPGNKEFLEAENSASASTQSFDTSKNAKPHINRQEKSSKKAIIVTILSLLGIGLIYRIWKRHNTLKRLRSSQRHETPLEPDSTPEEPPRDITRTYRSFITFGFEIEFLVKPQLGLSDDERFTEEQRQRIIDGIENVIRPHGWVLDKNSKNTLEVKTKVYSNTSDAWESLITGLSDINNALPRGMYSLHMHIGSKMHITSDRKLKADDARLARLVKVYEAQWRALAGKAYTEPSSGYVHVLPDEAITQKDSVHRHGAIINLSFRHPTIEIKIMSGLLNRQNHLDTSNLQERIRWTFALLMAAVDEMERMPIAVMGIPTIAGDKPNEKQIKNFAALVFDGDPAGRDIVLRHFHTLRNESPGLSRIKRAWRREQVRQAYKKVGLEKVYMLHEMYDRWDEDIVRHLLEGTTATEIGDMLRQLAEDLVRAGASDEVALGYFPAEMHEPLLRALHEARSRVPKRAIRPRRVPDWLQDAFQPASQEALRRYEQARSQGRIPRSPLLSDDNEQQDNGDHAGTGDRTDSGSNREKQTPPATPSSAPSSTGYGSGNVRNADSGQIPGSERSPDAQPERSNSQSNPQTVSPANNVNMPSSPLPEPPTGEVDETENNMEEQPAGADAGKQDAKSQDETVEVDSEGILELKKEIGRIVGRISDEMLDKIVTKLLNLSDFDLQQPLKIMDVFGYVTYESGIAFSKFNMNITKAILVMLTVQRFKNRHEDDSQSGAGVIPSFQSRWQRFMQNEWLPGSLKGWLERVNYRTSVAPWLEGIYFGLPLLLGLGVYAVGSYFGFEVNPIFVSLLAMTNVATKWRFLKRHERERALPEDIRAAKIIAVGNILTTAVLLSFLPGLNLPIIGTVTMPFAIFAAQLTEIAWHWLVNFRKPGKLSEIMPTDDRDSSEMNRDMAILKDWMGNLPTQEQSATVKRSPFLLAVLLAPMLVIMLATTVLAAPSVEQTGSMSWAINNIATLIAGGVGMSYFARKMGRETGESGELHKEKTSSQQVISEEHVDILHEWIKDNELGEHLSSIIVAFAYNNPTHLTIDIRDKVYQAFPNELATKEAVRKFLETFNELQFKQLFEAVKVLVKVKYFKAHDSQYRLEPTLKQYDEAFRQLVEQVTFMLRQSSTATSQSYDLDHGGEVTLRFNERLDRSNPLEINVDGIKIAMIWHEDDGSIKLLDKSGYPAFLIGLPRGKNFFLLNPASSQAIISIKDLGDNQIIIRDINSRTGTIVIAPVTVTSDEGVRRSEHPVLTDAEKHLKDVETVFSRLYQNRSLTSQERVQLDELFSKYKQLNKVVQSAQRIWMEGSMGTDDERHINQVKDKVNDLLLQLKIFERKKKNPEVAQKLKQFETMLSDVEITKLRNLLNDFSSKSEQQSWEERLNNRIERDKRTKLNIERKLESIWGLSADFQFESNYSDIFVSVENAITLWLIFKEELISASQQAKERFKQQGGEVRDIRTLNLYEELGVAKTATSGEIKKAYYALAKKYHPNFNPGNKFAEARFKEIANIYEVLSDPERRKYYDDYGLILKKQSDYIDGWSFFGKDFSWGPVIGALYRLGAAQKEVREAFLGALRNMGLDELARQLEGIWKAVDERRPMNRAATRQRRLINQATTEQGIEMFRAVLNPFMTSYEVARVVINVVTGETIGRRLINQAATQPGINFGYALGKVAGPEKAREIMGNIIRPLAELGLQPTDIEVVKSLNPHPALSQRERGRDEGKSFDHTFMTFTRDINGRLKIFISEKVLNKYAEAGKLEKFLKISLIHEILEYSGLTHRQVEQAGFKLNDTKTANKSIKKLIKLAKETARKNGVGIEARSFAKIRDSIANELDKIIPGIKNNLVSVFDQKIDVPDTDKENYRSLVGALHLLRMADIFRGDASARRNVKVGEIKWDETAARAVWYMSSDELADLMDTYQDWHESGKFAQKKLTSKSAREIQQYNEALAAYAIKLFKTQGALNANPGLPGTGMNIDEAVQVFQKKISLLTKKKFELSGEQAEVLKKAAEVGVEETRNLERAAPKETESLIKEQTGTAMLGLFEVSALSENALSQMYGILKLVSKGLAKDVVLPLITNKDAIDEDAIKQALIEMAKKDDDMGKENMEEALKATHFGELKIIRADLAEKLGIDPGLLVEIDTETVYEMVQEWADANKGKLRFSKRYGPVQVFTETPNHWKKSWREDIELTILAIISATQVIKISGQTEEHLKLIKQLNIQA